MDVLWWILLRVMLEPGTSFSNADIGRSDLAATERRSDVKISQLPHRIEPMVETPGRDGEGGS